jgi:hypothetical protein
VFVFFNLPELSAPAAARLILLLKLQHGIPNILAHGLDIEPLRGAYIGMALNGLDHGVPGTESLFRLVARPRRYPAILSILTHANQIWT